MSSIDKVEKLMEEGMKPAQIAKKLKLARAYVYKLTSEVRKKNNVPLKRGKKTEQVTVSVFDMIEPLKDEVNHPPHYKIGGIETIDYIEAKQFNYNLGNAVKYISRAGWKTDYEQDLKKAVWYLQREINHCATLAK